MANFFWWLGRKSKTFFFIKIKVINCLPKKRKRLNKVKKKDKKKKKHTKRRKKKQLGKVMIVERNKEYIKLLDKGTIFKGNDNNV